MQQPHLCPQHYEPGTARKLENAPYLNNMHGLAHQQVQAMRAMCLLVKPVVLMTTVVIIIVSLGGWIFQLIVMMSTSVAAGEDSADPTSPSIAGHPCAVLHHAFSLASTACCDTATFAHHHQHAVIGLSPVLLSFVVAIIVPCLVFLCVQYQIWRGELRLEDDFLRPLPILPVDAGDSNDQNNDRTTMRNERRRMEFLEKYLRCYTHTVEKNNFVIRPTCSQSRATASTCLVGNDAQYLRSCEEECCQSSLLVPRPGRTSGDDGPKREVQNLCCICLGDYRCGQKIVWSPSRACSHVFHESCAMPWLVRTHRCPMCRRHFA